MTTEGTHKPALLEAAAALREVHRTLVQATRASYEQKNGPAGGPGEMLRLLTEHPHFAWLHPMSELIVDLDSLLAQEILPSGTVAAVRQEIDRLTQAGGSPFWDKYAPLLQTDADGVMPHVRQRRAAHAHLATREPAQSFVVDEVVPVAVSDGNADDVAHRVPSRPRGHRVLHFEVDVPADVLQRVVAAHGAWQQSGLQQDLEAVADADQVPAAVGELPDLLHDWREARDRPGAQVVAVREPSGQHHDVRPAQVAILVPDVARGAAENVLCHVVHVVVAVAAREDDHREEHQRISSTRYSSMTVFARSFSHMSSTRFFASAGSFASRSSSMTFPRRTSFTSLKPSEPSARPTASPCGSSTDFFSVTTTRAFMRVLRRRAP